MLSLCILLLIVEVLKSFYMLSNMSVRSCFPSHHWVMLFVTYTTNVNNSATQIVENSWMIDYL